MHETDPHEVTLGMSLERQRVEVSIDVTRARRVQPKKL
jgi:hypothetical protein